MQKLFLINKLVECFEGKNDGYYFRYCYSFHCEYLTNQIQQDEEDRYANSQENMLVKQMTEDISEGATSHGQLGNLG